MGANSKIEWTHHTFNPWWGCVKVSPGCEHCYAESFAKRTGHSIWGPAATTERRTFGDKHWIEPIKWNADAIKEGERRRVFCASMADVFENHSALESERWRLWNLIDETPMLDWLLLTKRPQNVNDMVPAEWRNVNKWPVNVWLGTSVENEEQMDKRIPYLLSVPSSIRFLSCEPLLGPLPLAPYLTGKMISWVIVGGESGPNARQVNPEWVRSLRNQCNDADVSFHFKQWGGKDKKAAGRTLDGRTWDEYPTLRY